MLPHKQREFYMARWTTVLLIGALFSWGCTSFKSNVEPASDRAAPRADTLAFDPDLFADYRRQIDSAAALYAFGDIVDFVSTRDTLRSSIDGIIDRHPSVVFHPEFRELISGLSELDALYPADGSVHTYLDETDSLALSIESWPDIDSTQSGVTGPVSDDSPFPVISNDRIDFWIRYFTGPGRDHFERALYRMQLYRPTIEDVLEELGLHGDLICVALIESGFNLKARSRARAVGPWQFIAGTARMYGLRVNWWYDERRDIIASTYAAGNYLKDLNGLWNDWFLALAAYNCGEYRVVRAIARQKTQDFWELKLPRQTQRYVPKFLAALYILRDPGKYGITIPDVEPIKFDQVTVQDATDINLIARSAGTSVDFVMELNPSVLRWCTPPNTEIALKVPVGKGDECARKLEAIPPDQRVTWRKHQIRPGETLSLIAGEYNTTVTTLKRLNGITNAHRIRAGRTLIVPIQGAYSEVASSKPGYRDKHRDIDKKALEKYAKRFEPPADHKRVVYRVKDRDTLGEIAEVFHTSAKKIRYWNNLSYRSYIHPGQKLVIYVPESFDLSRVPPGKPGTPTGEDFVKRRYTVKRGDTFYSISRRFNVGVSDLITWNEKSRRSVIYPGDVLEIWEKKSK